MANVSRVNGFRPVRHLDGSPWNGQVERFYIPVSNGAAIFQGDVVSLLTGGEAGTGVPSIVKTASGGTTAAVGVVVGFAINPLNLNSPQYAPAATAMYALISTSPDVIYEVQSQVVITDFSANAAFTDAGGSVVTGMSGESLSATNTTATTTMKLVGASAKVDNDVTSVNAKVLVVINNHQYGAGTGTVGV